ncbi:MAG: hypothetical protein AB8G86_24655 [Saprospiraceae bacterium]
MKHKSFKYWSRQDIADKFGLDTNSNCQYLDNWLNTSIEVTNTEKEALTRLQKKLRANVDLWNEQELIIKFIALLIDMVDYDNLNYKAFANRKLSGLIDGEEVSGEVDLMIASGKYEPKAPFFCLHEFKKEQGTDNDPYGQLLIAMMTAAEINQTNEPVYGAFVIGRNWFFLTLKDRKYCVSDEFVATRADIFTIYQILKNLNLLISEIVTNQTLSELPGEAK